MGLKEPAESNNTQYDYLKLQHSKDEFLKSITSMTTSNDDNKKSVNLHCASDKALAKQMHTWTVCCSVLYILVDISSFLEYIPYING